MKLILNKVKMEPAPAPRRLCCPNCGHTEILGTWSEISHGTCVIELGGPSTGYEFMIDEGEVTDFRVEAFFCDACSLESEDLEDFIVGG